VEPASAPNRRGLAQWAALAVSIAALAAVVTWASHQAPPKLPSSPKQLEAVLGALCVYVIGMAIRGERWWRILRHQGAESTRGDAYALTVVGYMGNSVLPARAGDAIRTYLQSARSGASLRSVLGTLVAERILDLVVLLGLFVILAYGVLNGIAAPGGGRVVLPLAIAAGLATLLAIAWTVARRRPGGRRALAWLAPLLRATRGLSGRHGAAMLAITVAIWSTEATVYLLAGEAVGLHLSALDALYLLAVAGVFVLIPSGPGYLGTFELALVFGLNAIDAPSETSVSFVIMLRFLLTVPVTIAGAALLIGRYGGLEALRGARARARAGVSRASAS
jgi:uncharacterized membrane protein YbhN (UPF0104 family)